MDRQFLKKTNRRKDDEQITNPKNSELEISERAMQGSFLRTLGLGYMRFLTPGQRKLFIEAFPRGRKIVCVT